jgi:methionine-rich copper-binding protein CopC
MTGTTRAARTPRTAGWRPAAGMAMPLALGLLAIALGAPAIASAHAAHAYYVSSDPAAGAVVKTAPSVVTVHFAENVNPQGSDIVVYDATHKAVSTAAAQVSRSDLKTMTVPMKGDGAEIYLVEWHTVSADDGDPDIGAFTFSVIASGKADPSAGPATGATTGGSNTSTGSTGTPVWLTVLVGLVGLALGAGGAYVALTRGAAGRPGSRRV